MHNLHACALWEGMKLFCRKFQLGRDIPGTEIRRSAK